MGRSNGALAQHNPFEALAQWLDALRQGKGMSWSQLAQKVSERGLPPSESTLYRAVRRKSLPKWRTVQAFTRVCGGAEQEAKRLWTAAARYAAGRTDRVPRGAALPPQLITEPWQLIQAMDHRRRADGNPTLRELQRRALVDGGGTASHLPKSTLGAVLRGRMPTRALLGYFVRYCGGGTQDEVAEWDAAWERAHAYLRGERLPEESVRQEQARIQADLQELARVRAELAEVRERLGQTTADLARTVRTAHSAPVLAVAPLPGTFRPYLRPATEDGGRGASLPTVCRREPGGGVHHVQAPAVPGGEACEDPPADPGLPTRTGQTGPAAVIPIDEGPAAVPVRRPRRIPLCGRQDARK
ncbi:hypothetical protein ACFZDK_54520 [Streptomyces sp. NPDC007901]|uniref:hypothetical protein n=1 Tax=Streptomyces sp. NPDC007901 TaxID=3364785 RepID=UPI0036E7589B